MSHFYSLDTTGVSIVCDFCQCQYFLRHEKVFFFHSKSVADSFSQCFPVLLNPFLRLDDIGVTIRFSHYMFEKNKIIMIIIIKITIILT